MAGTVNSLAATTGSIEDLLGEQITTQDEREDLTRPGRARKTFWVLSGRVYNFPKEGSKEILAALGSTDATTMAPGLLDSSRSTHASVCGPCSAVDTPPCVAQRV